MIITNSKNGILLTNNKGTLLWCTNEECKLSGEEIDAYINPFSKINDLDQLKATKPMLIQGEGEWDFKSILVEGYIGEKNNFYLIDTENVTSLFVSNLSDIDDAFKEIQADIDVFIIDMVSIEDQVSNIKKEMDSIDTGIIIFTGKAVSNIEVQQTIQKTLNLENIEIKNKIKIEYPIVQKKEIIILN